MVASVSALTSSAQASSYYEADDYYAEGGLSPSEWQGKGAKALSLSGEVDRDRFRALLDGKVAGEQLGTMRGGQLEHRPGWDVTLSAPKSVSIMAEVAGDRRLIAAHGHAVRTAMAHVEAHMAATRVRGGGAIVREATGNLIIASFQHGTSRAQDPQLHTHNVIMNATQGEDGSWRSLEPRAIYQLQKQIGAIYRQELALQVRELGYDIEVGKDSLFEDQGCVRRGVGRVQHAQRRDRGGAGRARHVARHRERWGKAGCGARYAASEGRGRSCRACRGLAGDSRRIRVRAGGTAGNDRAGRSQGRRSCPRLAPPNAERRRGSACRRSGRRQAR